MGFPARVKRELTDDEVLGLSSFWKNYVDYTREYLQEECRGQAQTEHYRLLGLDQAILIP